MINKKIVKIIFSAVLVVNLFFVSCSKSNNVTALRVSTAEELVQIFNKCNEEENSDEMAKLYSKEYIESTGYDLATIQKILDKNRKKLDVISSKVKSIEDIDEKTKKAVIEINSKFDNKEETEEFTYALVKEEEGWAISPDGILNTEDVAVPQLIDKELNLRLSKRIDLIEDVILRVEVLNKSKNNYKFGSESNKCDVVVETTEGSFKTTMPEAVDVEKKANSYFMVRFADLNGDINKVYITNIYDTDKDGNIVENSKKDITIFEK